MRTLLLGRKMKATDAKTIQEIGINGTGGYGSGCRGRKGSKKR